MFWRCLCLDNCSIICAVTLCFILHQTHSEYWHIQNSIYSGIFRHLQGYSALLRQCTNIHSLTIFWSLAYLEQEAYSKSILWNFNQAYSELCHNQNDHDSLFRHYSAIFRHMPCVTLIYAETWHIWNPGLFRTFPWLRPEAYQNPVIFTKIGKHSVTLEIQKPGKTCRTLPKI